MSSESPRLAAALAGSAPGPNRRDLFGVWSGGMVISGDGQTAYALGRGASARIVHNGRAIAISLADGSVREILRFDEPARPHSTASMGVAEYGGWLYFTLSDFPSDIRVAGVSGLTR